MIASAYLLLFDQGKVLLARRYQTGYEDGNYSVPAGHVEDNESVLENLCREVKEEIGLQINPHQAQLCHVMHRKEKDIRMDFFFSLKDWQGVPQICEPDKCDELLWFAVDALPENTVGYIRQAIECTLRNQIYSERGWQ